MSIRKKDTQYDYRFMPEPNLMPLLVYPLKSFTPLKLKNEDTIVCTRNPELEIESGYLDKVRNIVTVKCFIDLDTAREELETKQLPHARRQHLVDTFRIKPEIAFTFVSHDLDVLLLKVIETLKVPLEEIPMYTQVLKYNYLHVVNLNTPMDKMSLSLQGQKIVSYVNDVLKAKKVSSRVSKQLFVDLFNQEEHLHKMTSDLISEKNLMIVNDSNLINECIQKLLSANSKAISEYKSKEKKREKIFDFFVGRVHKSFNETTDSDLVNKLVADALKNTLLS